MVFNLGDMHIGTECNSLLLLEIFHDKNWEKLKSF